MTRHVGIVGCSAPGAALCYETLCMEGTARAAENAPTFEVSMHTHPFTEYMRRIGADDRDGVAELMLSSAEKLGRLGAEFLIAPCNTIHHAFEKVVGRSPLPWLHIAEEVAREAKERGFTCIGLLGTTLMMEGPTYRAAFARAGIGYQIPETQDRRRVNELIFAEMVRGLFTPEARAYVLNVVDRLRGEGCDAVGLCCTEIPLLLGAESASLPLLDSNSRPGESGAGEGDRINSRHAARSKDQRGTARRA